MVSQDLYSIGAQHKVFITVSAYVPISVGSASLYFVSNMSLLQILHHSFCNKLVPLCLFLSISHTTIFHVHGHQYSHTHTHTLCTHIHCTHTLYTHTRRHTHTLLTHAHTNTQTHKKTHSHSKLLMLLFIFYPDDLKNAVSTLHLSYSGQT